VSSYPASDTLQSGGARNFHTASSDYEFLAFIEKGDQAEVIEKILKHCNLWGEPEQRGPPDVRGDPEVINNVTFVTFILEPESRRDIINQHLCCSN